jgi:hypothetical protein
MFLSSGADVNASSLDHKHANNSVTPFHLSARACCSVNHRDLQGREFWSIPALEIMQNLLRHKKNEKTGFVDIFAIDSKGRTALHNLCEDIDSDVRPAKFVLRCLHEIFVQVDKDFLSYGNSRQ